MTRSYPVIITYCYDAYVDIMGVSVYKGTTCKSYSPNMGGGGPGWYIAGGFPEYGTQTDYGSGGGGNGFYIGDNWQFGFPNLTKIYRYDSSLNVFQKSKLEHVIEMFYEDTTIPDYKKLYKKLLDNIEKGIVFSRDDDRIWICRNCGHIVIGKVAPEVCPTCNHPKSYFEIKAENY